MECVIYFCPKKDFYGGTRKTKSDVDLTAYGIDGLNETGSTKEALEKLTEN